MSSSLHAARPAGLAPGFFEPASVELFTTLRVQARWPFPLPAHGGPSVGLRVARPAGVSLLAPSCHHTLPGTCSPIT